MSDPTRAIMNDRPVDIYVRVSRRSGRSDEKFHSPAEQVQIAREFATRRGLPIGIELVPDIDKSGGTVDRDGLQQALARVRAGESGGMVVAWLDRLSRDSEQGHTLLRQIEEAGGKVYAPDAPEDTTTPEGELQLGLFLAIAQYQRKRARAGFGRAKERATLAGIPVGPVALGYRQRDDRTLEVDHDTAPVVRELFERRARGEGYTALSRILAERTGRTYTRQGIAAILANRIYATGRLEYDGTVSEHEAGAIVDEALWHAAQSPEAKPRERDGASLWLLSGLLKCATCGRNLAPWRASKAQGRTRRYRCPGGDKCTGRASIDAEKIESIAVARAFKLSGKLIATPAATVELAPLEAALERAERRLAQALAPEAQDALGDEWASTVKDRRTARAAAASALGKARLDAGVPEDGKTYELPNVWHDLTPDSQREALAWYIDQIDVAPRKRGEKVSTENVTIVPRASRPWKPIEYQPTTLDWKPPK